jgi:hypothetical protein
VHSRIENCISFPKKESKKKTSKRGQVKENKQKQAKTSEMNVSSGGDDHVYFWANSSTTLLCQSPVKLKLTTSESLSRQTN